MCASLKMKHIQDLVVIKKSDNVNIFWTPNLVLPLLGYPTLNGGVASSLYAFRCQVQCRLTTRYVISTT